MWKRVQTAMKSSVRNAFKAIRLLQKYHHLQKSSQRNFREPSFFLMLETGYYTNLSGCGHLFDKFVRTKMLNGYSGQNEEIAKPNDCEFWKSKLRYMPFDSTFTFIPGNVNDR